MKQSKMGAYMNINVIDYLINTEKNFPDKLAFEDEKEGITYSELKKYGEAIGTVISGENTIRRPVAIYLEKSVRVIASFMGILFSGNYYCPIDISMPDERARVILETLNPIAIITDEEHKASVEKIYSQAKILIYSEAIKGVIDEFALESIRERIIDADPAYVLFTSGSTGIPKGVVISHQSIIDYTEWVTETFDITSNDSFGNQAPFYFDNSILDIYSGIRNGATVYIIPQSFFAFPVNVVKYLISKKITTIFFVPSVLSMIARLRILKKIVPDTVKKVLFCGEVMPTKDLNVWREYLPGALYANLYGPTEITDVCSYYIVDREFGDDEPLPIGKACRNTEIILLDEEGNIPTHGELGEICIRGRSLALGYYNSKEKSDGVFVQNPTNDLYRDIIYKTGDLGYWNEYDELMYSCRKDFQIKHMGHRIELGEIETSMGDLESIDTCACIYDDAGKNIVLFYSGDSNETVIKEHLAKKVPEYMVPAKYVHINEFPHNANGKIDRKELKKIFAEAN